MRSLQLSNFRGSERSELSAAGLSPAAREPRRSTVSVIRSSFWGGSLEYMCDADMRARRRRMPVWRSSRVFPAPCAVLNLNVNVYTLKLEKPIGIRFALSV
ncbi:hypothetical protein AAHA92_29684 [Salvia divinorum]|uniref:Uncharacterized protein n=1 Tax=Salvia divinorum TaxID=28513 RepID=A0ABD1FZ54_SALDI